MLTKAQIRSMARVAASDTDASNPMWSDTNVDLFIQAWAADLSVYLRFPRETVTQSTVVGTYEYALPTDWLATISVTLVSPGVDATKLSFKDEQDIEEQDPDWRSDANGTPRRWFIGTDVTDSTTLSRKLTINPPPDAVKTLRHTYIRAPEMANDANIPPFNPALHITGVYFVASHMLMSLNPTLSEVLMRKYLDQRAKLAFNTGKETNEAKIVMK